MYLTEILFKEDTKFMKLNKSRILLISLISIFLLLSIGAAAAADNGENIADDVAIDDIDEVEDIDNNIKDVEVLSQSEESISDDILTEGEGEEGGDDPVDDSISTTIEANDTNYVFGDKIKINFTLKDNESNQINNTNKSNFKIYYKNETAEEFNDNDTVGFNITNESQFVLNNMPVGNYTLKIKFLNSTIGDKNYTESEVLVSLNITKSDTRINATDTKVKVSDDIIIPFKIYIESNRTLNVNASRLNVTCNGVEYGFTNLTGGTNITNGIKLTNFTKEVGIYEIFIQYSGNDNCNPSNVTINLSILENTTIVINGTVVFDFENNNITIPISVSNGTAALNINSEDILLKLKYVNETKSSTEKEISFSLIDNENGTYNISCILDAPLNNANLTIIYGNNTLNEANKTIAFTINNTINSEDTINVNNHTGNATIPISINSTAKITFDNNNITNETTLNLTGGDLSLVLTFNNGTDNKTINLTADKFTLTGENGTYNITFNLTSVFSPDEISFDNVTIDVIYAVNTLNETNKTIKAKGVLDLTIVPVNVTADYQDGYFVFNVTDSVTGEQMANTNINASGLWFYTFGDTSSLSGSKTFTTDENGLLFIKNENMHPNLDITGYTAGFVALPVGTYNITFKASDALVLDNKSEIKVNKVQAKIIASNMVSDFGNVVTYSYQIVNSKTGAPLKLVNALFRIYAGNLDATRSGSTNLTGYYTSPSLNLTANKYSLQLKSNDSNLVCSAVSKTLTVNKILATITASSKTVYFGSADNIVATIKSKKTGKVLPNTYVLLQIFTTAKKSVSYAVLSNSKGVVRFSPPTPLNVGKHKVRMTVLDNNYNSSILTRYVTVKKASGKFTASKITTYYRSGKLFKIKLTNTKTKKVIYGAKVNIKVYISKKKFYNYNGNTSTNGLIQFKIGYKPGTYKVVISGADKKNYNAKAITRYLKVKKHSLKFKPVSLKVKKGKNFKVKVISKKTKKALSGVKVKIKVYTGKKSKTYTKKSNKKGIASLKIKQKVGKHKVVVTVKNTKLYAAKKLKKTLKVKK